VHAVNRCLLISTNKEMQTKTPKGEKNLSKLFTNNAGTNQHQSRSETKFLKKEREKTSLYQVVAWSRETIKLNCALNLAVMRIHPCLILESTSNKSQSKFLHVADGGFLTS
jgi:hypothetical protein